MESFNNLESFSTFNSTGIYCKSGHLSEQTVQQLAERFCMPVLLYNVITVTLSKSECARLEHAWNVVIYKIYGVWDLLNFVYAYTNCLLIGVEMLLRQCSFRETVVKLIRCCIMYTG